MKRLLLLVILAIAVAGGGLGAWWFAVRGEPLPVAIGGGEVDATQDDATHFVEFEPLSFPIMQEGRVTELKTVVISLEVRGHDAGARVAGDRARLRDALLSELHGLYALRFVRERGDRMGLVRKRLLDASRDVLGEDVRGVFVQAVETRRTAD